MPIDPFQEFELIPWNDWLHHYWIETFSQFEPILFVRACDHTHEGHEHNHVQIRGRAELLTAFLEGEDGNTYKIIRRANGEAELVPVYTLKH